MKFAVHYSHSAADLLREGKIHIDYFKCPAWPDLIAGARKIQPVYVHFPLRVGPGIGDAIDTEKKQPADWARIESLLVQTETPFVNLHLAPTTGDYPDIPAYTTEPGHIERLTEQLCRDVQAVTARFGPEQVIVENIYSGGGRYLQPAFLPEVVSAVVRETGCGFLFDLSHARLAAHQLGWNVYEYINTLPIEYTCEIHLTGIQRIDEHWLARVRQDGVALKFLEEFAGQLMDHLPLTDEDWGFMSWLIAQLQTGVIKQPWMIALEYGGVGPLWETLTEVEVLLEQVPRLHRLIQSLQPNP